MITKNELQTYKEIVKKPRKDRTKEELATAYVIMMKHKQGLMYKFKNIQPIYNNLYK